MTKRRPEAHLPDPAKPRVDGLATPERAAEIAGMKEFGLAEFIELTGIGLGRHGIYRISREGVTVRDADDRAELLAPSDQLRTLRAEEKLELRFPCEPVRFQEWYDATRGENRVSDIPLAPGFLKALVRHGEASTSHLGPPCPSSKIVAAFKVKPNAADNKKWWDDRMRGAKRYGLLQARASIGRAKQQSRWHPVLVAAWLLEKKPQMRARVLREMEQHFPGVDTAYL